MRLVIAVALVLTTACAKPSRAVPVTFGGNRPVTISVPRAYAGKPAPLILALHGYGNSGKPFEAYLGLGRLVDEKGVLLVSPDGTLDAEGNRFWNAGSDACCNFGGSAVDDVAYLRELLREIRAAYNVDPKRIFVVGHSNGGFMAYRLACELPELAAIVSLAGATPNCSPKGPVSVLQIHGDRDFGVRFDGGTNILKRGGGAYPGAIESTTKWAKVAGCKETQSVGETIDLDSDAIGPETIVSTHDGCPPGVSVELWSIQEGSHVPDVTAAFPERVWPWLQAHTRP